MTAAHGVRPLSVLLIAPTLEPSGGRPLSELEVARGLVERGHRVDLLYCEEGPLREAWEGVASTIAQAPRAELQVRRPLRSTARSIRSVRRGRAHRPDVVYIHEVDLAFWAALVVLGRRVPVVFHARAIPAALGRNDRVGLRRVRTVIAIAEHVRGAWVRLGVDAARIVVVHNGVDTVRFHPVDASARRALRRSRGLDEDAPTFVYAGRLDEVKGVDVLCDAWPFVRAVHPGAQLVIAGAPSRPGRAAEQYVATLHEGAGPGAHFLGRVDDVVPLLQMADVAVLPSRFQEPLGRALLESLACGTPCVSSRVGGPAELLGDANLEWLLVDPEDPAALAQGMCRALERRNADPDSLATQLRDRVASGLTAEDAVARVERVLLDAVGHAGSSLVPSPRQAAS